MQPSSTPIARKIILTTGNSDPVTADDKDIRTMSECNVYRAFKTYDGVVIAVRADRIYWCFDNQEWTAEFDTYGVTTRYADDMTTESFPLKSCYSEENLALAKYLKDLDQEILESKKKLEEMSRLATGLEKQLSTTIIKSDNQNSNDLRLREDDPNRPKTRQELIEEIAELS